MLTELLLQKLTYDNSLIKSLVEAKKIVSDKECLKILTKMSSKIPGSKAYNFTLTSLSGKPINLSDFNGKTLIIDSYYEGCTMCILLTKSMEPIMEHFRNRDDVVFISLNAVDKDFKKFKRSAKSGKYGGKNTLYAYTGGLGQDHPMIRFYDYTGYPNQLIIDKNGDVISANPKRPNTREQAQKFIEMIERNL